MSLISKGYQEPDERDKYKEEEKCPTIVRCGCPRSTLIPAATAAGNTITLATFTLDTSCICNPNIILEFASNTIATAFRGTLTIRVLKQCRSQFTAVPIGSTWTLQLGVTGGTATVTNANTFSFSICDSDNCNNDCCTYTVVATVGGAATVGTLAINNATLGAVVSCREVCN